MNLRLYLSAKEPEKGASAEALLRSVLKEGGADLFSLSVLDLDADPAKAIEDNVSDAPTVVVSQEKQIYSFAGDPGLDEGHLRRILGLPLRD